MNTARRVLNLYIRGKAKEVSRQDIGLLRGCASPWGGNLAPDQLAQLVIDMRKNPVLC